MRVASASAAREAALARQDEAAALLEDPDDEDPDDDEPDDDEPDFEELSPEELDFDEVSLEDDDEPLSPELDDLEPLPPADPLYPSAYHLPPFRMKLGAEISRFAFALQTWQRVSGASVMR